MTDSTDAQHRAPYGRSASAPAADRSPRRPYAGETYYQKPALKPGHYRYLIANYFWVGGLAGAAAILAAVADLAGGPADQVIVRHGRYLALAGAVVSPVLLIADLQTPARFFNMLRIFRRTSPMSFGSWLLSAFGTLAGLTAAAQFAHDSAGWGWAATAARVLGLLLAAAGVGMTYYTGTLLTATSVPLWAAVPRLMAALFAASSASLAAAALIVTSTAAGATEPVTRRLVLFNFIALLTEAAVELAAHFTWHRRGLDGPLKRPPLAPLYHWGVWGLGVIVPLVLYAVVLATGRPPATLSVAGAVSALAGGILLRHVIVFAGRRSAESPQDYFHFTQPATDANGVARPAAAAPEESRHGHGPA